MEAGSHHLTVDVPEWPGHRPGQFAMLALDPSGLRVDPLLPRPMAVYRAEGERLRFAFKVVGKGTRLLSELMPGAPLGVVGPLGNGFPVPSGRPLLVGGGTGVASLYELAAAAGSDARVLLGGRSAADIIGLADFQALPVQLEVATDDGSMGHRGLVTDLLHPQTGDEVDPQTGDEIFACGPTPMMRRASEIASAAGVPCRVSLESHMACGFGVCLGCAVPVGGGFRYVCTHGPVFDASELDWANVP